MYIIKSYTLCSLLFFVNLTRADCLLNGKATSMINVGFYLKGDEVYATIKNMADEDISLSGLFFKKENPTFFIRFKEKNEILKIPPLQDEEGFITSAAFSSQLYARSEIPIITLSARETITIHNSSSRISSMHELPSLKNTEIQQQFMIFFDNKNDVRYKCYSNWNTIQTVL